MWTICLWGCGSKDLADRVSVGMSEAEVEEILGHLPRRESFKGTRTTSVDITSGQRIGTSTSGTKVVEFHDEAGARVISVTYRNNKVSEKSVGPITASSAPAEVAEVPVPKIEIRPPVNDKVTEETFKKIRPDMSVRQVESLLGGMGNIASGSDLPRDLASRDSVLTWWRWRGETHTIYVGEGRFPNSGRVVVMEYRENEPSNQP